MKRAKNHRMKYCYWHETSTLHRAGKCIKCLNYENSSEYKVLDDIFNKEMARRLEEAKILV